MLRARSLFRYLGILSLFVALAACGDSEVNSNTDLDRESANNAPSVSDRYFMVPAGEANFQANVASSVPLKVFLYDKVTGQPAGQQNITYEILEASPETSLSAKNASTDVEGAASVDVRLGATGTVLVLADHPSANGVEFVVEIVPLSTGDIEVSIVNTAPSITQMYDTQVRLYRADSFSCDEFRPLFGQDPGIVEGTAPTVDDVVTFEDLGTLQDFLITGIALGDQGQIVAAACEDNVVVRKDQVTDVELLMQLIPLNPVGKYDVTAFWDFTDALADSGTVGSTIVRVLNIFQNPGEAIYNEVIALIGNFFGNAISWVIDFLADSLGAADFLKNTINNFIEGNEALRKIRDAGRDLRDVVANLEVHSELTIGKLNSTYEFRGADNWLGVVLYWRWDCDANSPPDCGAIDLAADSAGEIADLGVLSSEWTGRVVGYNQLQIDTHSLTLRYGRLIIYILNDVIIPRITDNNANSLSEAFAYWIGCADIASSIGDISALGFNLSEAQIEGFCTSAVSTIFGFADLLITNLEFDIGLRLGGEGKLIELTSDGRVDEIREGTFTGYMESSEGGASSPFTATWEGVRRNNETDGL